MQQIQKDVGVYLLTVPYLEGYEIVEYYGMVHGNAIFGANFIKDFFARVIDTIGGRARGYERAVEGAMRESVTQMAKKAQKLGANAVVGVYVNTGAVSVRMLQASAVGTAVVVRKREAPGA